MDSFYTRLQVRLAAHESDRRAMLLMIVLFLVSTGFASWRTTFIVAGLCVMVEGWAMLVSKEKLEK